MTEFKSVVTDIRLESSAGTQQVWQMTLGETAFAPGDTGVLEATTRTGTRLQIPVTRVLRDADGALWHVVEKPLAAGTDVRGRITAQAA